MNIIEALEIGESLCASEAEQVLAGEVRELREQLAQERQRLDWALDEATARAERAEAEIAELEQYAERYRILCQESLTCWRDGNGVGLLIPQQSHSGAQELKEHCDEHVDAFIAETKRLIQVATR